ncbi:MAG: hypothetical protein Q9169_004217 [Polycauliona sp. 2 TL-2023]
MSLLSRTSTASRMIPTMAFNAVTAHPAVLSSNLGKRARDTGNDDDPFMSGTSKRLMTGPPATPPRTTLGRRPQWGIDRFSPRHRIFNTERTNSSVSGRYTIWMADIDAFFNPTFSPPSKSSSETPTGIQNGVPAMESRPIRHAVNPRATSSKPQSYQDALEAFRKERREAAAKIDRRAMVGGPFPQIGEEDELDMMAFNGESLPESRAGSVTGKKRGAEEALDEAMPNAPEDANAANIRGGKRQRSDAGDTSSADTSFAGSSSSSTSNPSTTSARRTSSTSSSSARSASGSISAKKSKRRSSYAKKALIDFNLSPTLKEVERMEVARRRSSPMGARIIKPGQLMDRAYRGDEAPVGAIGNTFLAGLSPVKVEQKSECMKETLKGRKIKGLVHRHKSL